jgi:ankyrin repeat protein
MEHSNIADLPEFVAVMRDDSMALRFALDSGVDPNREAIGGMTALMLSAERGSETSLSMLAAAGSCLDHQDQFGWTAIICAAKAGISGAVEILLKAGANPDLTDDAGWSALMWAAQNGHYDCAQLLVQAGASLDILDKFGNVALDFAEHKKHGRIVTLLRAHAEKSELDQLIEPRSGDLYSESSKRL